MKPGSAVAVRTETPADPADLIELGAVRGAYGVKGWLKIAPFDPQASVLHSTRRWWLKDGRRPWQAVDVTGVRRHSGSLLAKWREWDDPERAEAIRGATVAVPRSDFPPLPEGEFYWIDLVGAEVINRADQRLGKVEAVRSNGAHELIEVAGESGTLLIPLVAAYVDAVDLQGRTIRVDWQADWSR